MELVFAQRRELLKADPLLVPAGNTKVSRVRKLETAVDTSVDDARVLEQVVSYYHETLKTSPETLAYLNSRGLRSEEAITKFRLGFANRTLGLRLPSSDRAAGVAMRGRLQALSVLREPGMSISMGRWSFLSLAKAGHGGGERSDFVTSL